MSCLTAKLKLYNYTVLHLGRSPAGFQENALGQSIARTGWSWGCSGFDLDNDGFPEVYVANGLESRESVTDYELAGRPPAAGSAYEVIVRCPVWT